MIKMMVSLMLSVMAMASWAFAQDSDSGVLVSSPDHGQEMDQSGLVDDGSSDQTETPKHEKHHHSDSDQDASAQNNTGDNNNTEAADSDDIINKSVDVIMQQILANMKLTSDQISAVRLIIKNNVTQVRALQLSVEDGKIDSKAMNDQRQQLAVVEDQQLSQILSSDQMNVWMNIQNE